MDSIFLKFENNVKDIRLCDLFFCCNSDQLAVEDDFFFENIFKPKNDLYIGILKYEENFNYNMSAPEMSLSENFLINSKRIYDQQVDIWNLGCIVYNLVCGVPPF